ncbi:MAG: hypothetical protein JO321_12095 [Solirubrobacterales bacterium]|nr:hypothetical protein [Solirubrobacterales bacterium]
MVVGPDYAKVSDARLLAAADPDAFSVLYDRHVAQLFSWARARVGDYAADLTAEVFARAWLNRDSFRDKADERGCRGFMGSRITYCATRFASDGSRTGREGGLVCRTRSRPIPSMRPSSAGFRCRRLRCGRSHSFPTATARCSSCASCRNGPIRRSRGGFLARHRPLGFVSHGPYTGSTSLLRKRP